MSTIPKDIEEFLDSNSVYYSETILDSILSKLGYEELDELMFILEELQINASEALD